MGEHILSLVGNADRKILPWFSSLPTFSLKRANFLHYVHTERNCILCALHICAKECVGMENMTRMLHSLFKVSINCFRWYMHKGIKDQNLEI